MPFTRTDRNQTYRDGVVIDEQVVQVDITIPVVTLDLHQKARDALAANVTSLGQLPAAQAAVATALTNAQAVIDATTTTAPQVKVALNALAAEVKRMATVTGGLLTTNARSLRVDNQLIRLLIGDDLIAENTDT